MWTSPFTHTSGEELNGEETVARMKEGGCYLQDVWS